MSAIMDGIFKWFWGVVESHDIARQSKQTLPDGVTAITDIAYLEDGKKEHLLDVYYPEGTVDKLPVIIDIHGGGLMYAYKELNKNYNYNLAKRGFCVFSINYSLAPEYRFPQCLLDTVDALRWIANNMDNYPADSDRVYITGDSAGGFLAAHSVLLNSSEELRNFYNVEPIGLKIRAAGLTSGMFTLKTTIAAFMAPSILGKGSLKKSKYKDVLDLAKIIDKGEFVPSFLVTSKEDFIQKATLDFQKLLESKGIEHVMKNYPKTKGGNKLEHVFSVLYPIEYAESIETIDAMIDFFNKH